MSTYPAVIPSARNHTPGSYPVTAYAATSREETRLRHGNRITGQMLTLAYDNITEDEWLELRVHYLAHEPIRRSFNLPAEVLQGETSAQFVAEGYSWIYAGMVEMEGIQPDVHSVAVTLERIPEPAPEGFLVLSVPAAFVANPRPAQLLYNRKILGQAAAFTTTGQPATIRKTTAFITTGQRAQLLYNRVIKGQVAAFGMTGQPAEIIKTVINDPHFANVTWLLQMNGVNGLAVFTDSSSFARSSTAHGAAQTSTAQVKWGSASGSFNGTNSHIRTTATTDLQLTGDFTIETWVYPNSSADMMLAGSQSTNNTQIFRFNEGGVAGRLSLYDGSAYVFQNLTAGITANTWQHVAFARTGTTTRAFVGGTLIATNASWSGTLRCDVVGSSWFSGAGYQWANAYVDDFRITKGVCRYTAGFSPPDGPFPTS